MEVHVFQFLLGFYRTALSELYFRWQDLFQFLLGFYFGACFNVPDVERYAAFNSFWDSTHLQKHTLRGAGARFQFLLGFYLYRDVASLIESENFQFLLGFYTRSSPSWPR